ncbi:MAG: hypothetical protein F6K36_11120 [Symploca sp. SIO3C6]|uniref:Uncharacterized protein n=1 Tax=Symploca sp. SIO1C4 TaxID=2607765 RepID=A0A6B3N9B1_9CYAN|nr:hypothetical protein [Symploca sp. SIO3C6]NER30196.1 hypothetical protein [Symploca sp. SIO1C4]
MSNGESELPVSKYPVSPFKIAETIQGLMDQLPPRRLKGNLTYENVIKYYIEEMPHEFGVKCGVCLHQKRKKHFSFVQVFLFDSGNLVMRSDSRIYGRLLEIDGFDEELSEAFGNFNVLFLES